MRRKTNEEYLKQVLNTEYEPLETYKGDKVKILHLCLTCTNEWLVTPNNILKGHGCPSCGGTQRKDHSKYTQELFNTEYECLSEYKNTKTKLLHRHKVCGHEWLVKPCDLLEGYGCPECSGRSANRVYLIYFPELELYKVGISNNVNKRIKRFGYDCELVWVEEYNTHEQALSREREILSKVKLVNTNLLTSGNTETFAGMM